MTATIAIQPEAPAKGVEKQRFLPAPELQDGKAAADVGGARSRPQLPRLLVESSGPTEVPGYRTRWLYFAQFAWASCFARFMSLYYLDEGLNEAEIGVVFAAGSLTGPFVSTLVGLLVDRLSLRIRAAKHLCYAACVILGTLFFSLQALHFEQVRRVHVMFVFRVAFNACNQSGLVLLDAITLEVLSDKKRFGEERLYGAVSWAIMHITLGILIDRYGRLTQHVIVIIGCVSVLVVLVVHGVPKRTEGEPASGTPSKAKAKAGLAALADNRALYALFQDWCSRKTVLAFFTYIVFLGYGMAIVEHIIFLYFKELNASNFLCGLSVVVTVVFEIPLFSRSKQLLEDYGEHTLLTMAGMCYSFRVVGYTLCPGGWWVLLFEPMHGVTIALSSTASVQMMATITPEAFVATGQAFLSLLRSCVGSSLGTLVGGAIIREYSEKACYRTSAVLVMFGLLVYRISLWCFAEPPRQEVQHAEEQGGGAESAKVEGAIKPDVVGQRTPDALEGRRVSC